jgi:hypothetical protein
MKMTPALVSGNTMVLKTSEKSPLSPLIAGKAMKKIGFPPGVFNIVHGYGRPTGEALSVSPGSLERTRRPYAAKLPRKASVPNHHLNAIFQIAP